MTPELDLIEQLRETTLSPAQEAIVDELDAILKKDVLWPEPVRVAAEAAFGGSIHNPTSRTHGQIDRRVRHALRLWRQRYVGLNPQQMEYAGDVLAWAIRSGAADAPSPQKRFAFVFTRLKNVLNDERVDEGMKRRSGKVDVSEQLAEAFAA